jgi:site-specific recombinase XerD
MVDQNHCLLPKEDAMGQLRDRMTDDMKLANFSPSTIRYYLHYCKSFAKYFMRSPTQMGEKEVRTFLLHLLYERKFSHSSYRQCYAALKFLYTVTLKRGFEVETIPRPRKVYKLKEVLSGTEVESLLSSFTHPKYRAVTMAIYAAGLRVTEACRLCVQDIDSKRMLIHIRQGKGNKDRFVMLSKRLLHTLREWWKIAQPKDYLFEAKLGLGHPMSCTAFRTALKRATVKAKIRKRVTAHILRHSFATHLMELDTDITVIQALLGHRYIKDSTRYIHVSTKRIRQIKSPLDLLGTKKAKVLG